MLTDLSVSKHVCPRRQLHGLRRTARTMSSTDDEKMDIDDSSTLSALRANIAKKGSNSYYYAHGKKVDGPVWDGQESPRLIAKTVIAKDGFVKPILQMTDYSWSDGKKVVSIYVDYPNADQVDDENIAVDFTESSVTFSLTKPDENKIYKLIITDLHDKIINAIVKKKSDKFTITLQKENESSWYQLKKKN